jgi:hypothetical protein|nr:hypothetical protein [Kofleriaceae bacterium]
MSNDRFGHRYITQSEFVTYAAHLGLDDRFIEAKLEFVERFGILMPAARVRFPDAVVRSWFQAQHPNIRVLHPIEPVGERLTTATELRNALSSELVRPAGQHLLEVVPAKYRQYVSKNLSPMRFKAWDTFTTPLFLADDEEVGNAAEVHTYYHAWQVFRLAAFLRSGFSVHYDVTKQHAWDDLLDLRDRSDVCFSVNIDATGELKILQDNASLFDAVAQFDDLRNRALQSYTSDIDRRTSRLSAAASRAYRLLEVKLARKVMATSVGSGKRMIAFLRALCTLWSGASEHHPPGIIEAYRQTISSTILVLRLARRGYSAKAIVAQVGVVGGWRRPALDVIFPNWVREQRGVVEASLSLWIVPHLAQLPPGFAFSRSDVPIFCDWLEANGFLQFYWHFRRLTEVSAFDDDIGRSAMAAEIIGLSSLIEHIVTTALRARRPPANVQTLRGVLVPKLLSLLRPQNADLAIELEKCKQLRTTTERTLRQQLQRVSRMRSIGPNTPALQVLLRFVLIRNTATHAGLSGFGRDELQTLVESLLIAALAVWKAR